MPARKTIDTYDFNKLYALSMVSGVNLPKLSAEQREIVETVDKNVLVQGVAGSGKTNICIDKIIYTACKNYTGKTLYTTFSRGLLTDTKLKVDSFKEDLKEVLLAYKNGNIIFLSNDHKKALENRLGIYFFSDDDNKIFEKIERLISYLENKVDYLLIEDIYRNKKAKASYSSIVLYSFFHILQLLQVCQLRQYFHLYLHHLGLNHQGIKRMFLEF